MVQKIALVTGCVLNKAKNKTDYNLHIPYWKNSLDTCLNAIGDKMTAIREFMKVKNHKLEINLMKKF